MIRIAYVIDSIETPNAGTEKQLLLLIDNIDRTQFEPHLIVLRSSPWLDENQISCPVHNIHLTSFFSSHILLSFFSFRKYCITNQIDIVQTFFRDANIFGTIAAKLSNIKSIISSRRNIGEGYWHNTNWLTILKGLDKITDCYIINSRTTADYTVQKERVSESKIRIIYNGLVLNKFRINIEKDRKTAREMLCIEDSAVLIGLVANLRPVKNIGLFIDAAKIIHEKHENTRFIVIGEGAEREKLQERIDNNGLEKHFRLLGRISDVIPYLNAMDIGVLCSKSESLSNTIIEYMASGIPCVVSDVGGNRETIGERLGFLFKDNDVIDLADKIEKLTVDVGMRKDIGERAQQFAFERYDYKKCIDQHQDLYKSFLS